MTHLSPYATRRPPPSRVLTSLPIPAPAGNRSRLDDALAAKRAVVGRLEAAWVAASETDAARGRAHGVRIDDRATWDRATWQRYLAAAAAHEPEFLPRIMRLLREIDSLEALLAMPDQTRAA